jgi:adenylate cyclase
MGEPEAALPYFEKALAVAPSLQNVVYLYSGLGFCHLALRHTDQAIDFFRKARAANPRLWYIHMGLAAALGLNGYLVEAKEALGELIKLRPDVTSLSKTWTAEYDGPPPAAYNELPLYIGLRRAGMPEE